MVEYEVQCALDSLSSELSHRIEDCIDRVSNLSDEVSRDLEATRVARMELRRDLSQSIEQKNEELAEAFNKIQEIETKFTDLQGWDAPSGTTAHDRLMLRFSGASDHVQKLHERVDRLGAKLDAYSPKALQEEIGNQAIVERIEALNKRCDAFGKFAASHQHPEFDRSINEIGEKFSEVDSYIGLVDAKACKAAQKADEIEESIDVVAQAQGGLARSNVQIRGMFDDWEAFRHQIDQVIPDHWKVIQALSSRVDHIDKSYDRCIDSHSTRLDKLEESFYAPPDIEDDPIVRLWNELDERKKIIDDSISMILERLRALEEQPVVSGDLTTSLSHRIVAIEDRVEAIGNLDAALINRLDRRISKLVDHVTDLEKKFIDKAGRGIDLNYEMKRINKALEAHWERIADLVNSARKVHSDVDNLKISKKLIEGERKRVQGEDTKKTD